MVLGEGSWGKGGERSIRGSGEERKIDTLPSPSVPDTAHVATPILCCPSAGRPTNPALNRQTGTRGVGDRGGGPAAFFREGFLSMPWSIYRSPSHQQGQKEGKDPQRSLGRKDKVEKSQVRKGKTNRGILLEKASVHHSPTWLPAP